MVFYQQLGGRRSIPLRRFWHVIRLNPQFDWPSPCALSGFLHIEARAHYAHQTQRSPSTVRQRTPTWYLTLCRRTVCRMQAKKNRG